jgi:hypothetical protein
MKMRDYPTLDTNPGKGRVLIAVLHITVKVGSSTMSKTRTLT